MSETGWARAFWAISFVLMLAALVAFQLGMAERLIVAVLLAGSAYGYVQSEKLLNFRNKHKVEAELDRKFEIRLIKTLNHHRHDWMNDIQLLFGYIKLKRYDNLPGYMDKIREKLQQESQISKLGDPRLVVYLLEFRTRSNDVQLEVELEEDIRLDELPLSRQEAADVIIDVVEAAREYAESGGDEPNVASLQLSLEPGHLLIDFVFRGSYRVEGLKAAIERNVLQSDRNLKLVHVEFGETEAAIAVGVLYNQVSN